MKSHRLLTKLGAAVGISIALCATGAGVQAATPDTWRLDKGAGGNGTHPSGDLRYVSSEGLGMTISGWFGDETGSGTLSENTADLRHWSGGLGLDRRGDRHTVDNAGSQDELIAFVFDDAVALSGVKFGWYENDSDATILYQTNKTAGFSGLGGTSISNLTTNGYSLLGNLYDPETRAQRVQGSTTSSFTGAVQTGQIYSKVWLVGAYLQGIVGNTASYARAFDSIKIKKLIAHRMPGTSVSAPATALLLGFGLLAMRRRQRING